MMTLGSRVTISDRWERTSSFGPVWRLTALPAGARGPAVPLQRTVDIHGSLSQEVPVCGTAIHGCPPSICQRFPQSGSSGVSAHSLRFVDKVVRFVPVRQKVCRLLIIHSDVVIIK